jgi:ATP-dependent Clp protease protease subunit
MNPYELRQKFYNLATSKTPWYKIVNQAHGPTQIHIFNTIGGFGVSAEDFIGELNAISGPVELRINSEGGEVFQAKPIYNALSRLPDVSVIIDGIAASAASFIAMAASPGKLYMSTIATMMIHDGHAVAMGSASDLRSLADVLEKESNTIAGIYARRSGKDPDHFRELMKTETWYNSQEALDEGICDGIIDARSGKITNSLGNAASVPWVSDRQTRHEPTTVEHTHDHAANGAGDDDDGIHSHKHTHSGDATHDHTHEAGITNSGADDGDDGRRSGMVEGSTDTIVLASAFPEAVFYDRAFSTEQRKKAAKSGAAMKDGSYPIETCGDATNARTAYGRAPEGKRSAVAAHIRSREKALKCGGEPFSPGAEDSTDFVLSDDVIKQFMSQL